MSIHPILLKQLQKLESDAEFTQYFAKIGLEHEEEQYIGEAESLKHIAAAAPGLAPSVAASGLDGKKPFLITEYKDLTSLNDAAARRLGKRLATELHAYKGLEGFGFGVPTYCGATRLQNGWFDRWDDCFSAMIGDLLTQLKKKGPLIIQPVLLHGDLWSGNMGTEASSREPIIFDPASFYGHNEADLAIARIFGGVPKTFFETYEQHHPKTDPVDQYELRGYLYELFHYLNHTLLFGVRTTNLPRPVLNSFSGTLCFQCRDENGHPTSSRSEVVRDCDAHSYTIFLYTRRGTLNLCST
ncbi:fructosamine kinase PKL/CAK/FruK [Mycena olivaceomarginata]|nr:fructosamine kinase PKL/CAK/FruK [Mycena olivaceomarginata]